MRQLITLFILLLIISCTPGDMSRADFLVGTWKIDGSDQYEVWEITDKNKLSGYAYKLQDGQENVTETLAIAFVDGNLVYEATVPNQNDGMTILFPLNNSINNYLSFENIEHDFPKKIQYKKITNDIVEVSVLGESDEGFNYRQIRQN